jgi:hypothetical protein
MKQKIVKEGYNKAAGNYSAQRDELKNLPYLERLEKRNQIALPSWLYL